ncbi:DnaJ domain-containing protein [Acaryochloris sp. IP29b_bin.148]|uniref:DnaJ domain-containing protein n=1 Tax=Acaryochloris sp. IP29b_bin.148 TaxID=2969218 RepID=UPI0026133C1D|nr:DnaJ domain-containing protein [Acaryochloris sp. IP29b_bin.148]
MVNSQDHYSVLQVSPQATPADIKSAFRRLVRQYHPDLNPNSPRAAAAFQKICTAYEVLSNHEQRVLFDHDYCPPSPLIEEPGSVILQDAQQYFMQGVHKANRRNYAAAIADFTQAIHLKKGYLEAYMGRCQARFTLGHNREVLRDCDHILSLQPQSAQAFFFRGRACYRLGHLDLAIESYAKAIAIEPEYAQAFFHRGIVYIKVQERLAARDLQTAAVLFRQQGHIGNYQRAIATLKDLNRKPANVALNLPRNGVALVATTLRTLPQFLVSPSNAALHVWQSQLPYQSVGISLIFAGLALGCVVGGVHFYDPTFLTLSYSQLLLLGTAAFCSLVLTGGLVRQMVGKGGSWSGDCLIAGAAVLPVGVWAIISGLMMGLGQIELITLSLFTASYAILSLYSGYTKIGQISESIAAFAVPAILMICYGVTALIYRALTLQLV